MNKKQIARQASPRPGQRVSTSKPRGRGGRRWRRRLFIESLEDRRVLAVGSFELGLIGPLQHHSATQSVSDARISVFSTDIGIVNSGQPQAEGESGKLDNRIDAGVCFPNSVDSDWHLSASDLQLDATTRFATGLVYGPQLPAWVGADVNLDRDTAFDGLSEEIHSLAKSQSKHLSKTDVSVEIAVPSEGPVVRNIGAVGFDAARHALAQELAAGLTSTGRSDEFAYFQYDVNTDVTGEGFGAATGRMNVSSSLINMDLFRADPRFSGIDGSGSAVVVIDSGIQLNHPHFGPDNSGNGIADRIVYQYDFADNDNDATDFLGHGTHVTGTIASSDANYPGIAPGVDIIHLKVSRGQGDVLANAWIEDAVQWVVENVATYNIVAVNLSLGGGNDSVAQTNRYLSDEFAALADLGVITVAASGNRFFSLHSVPGVGYPSSDANAISVGSVWSGNHGWNAWEDGAIDYTTAADRVVSHSQRHDTLTDTLAPGAMITAAWLNGGVRAIGGTSMASPHVAGAAVLAQQIATTYLGRLLDINEFRELLQSSGVMIIDGDDEHDNVRNTGFSFPRLDMLALAEAILDLDSILEPDLTVLFSENFDSVTAPALPTYGLTGWTTSAAQGTAAWVTTTGGSFSGTNSAFVPNSDTVSDVRLTSPIWRIQLGDSENQLTFRNRFDLESNFDGGILEISIAGGDFQEILAAGGTFVSGGYTGTLGNTTGNPIGGRLAWTGNSNGYITTRVAFPESANGKHVQLRWRLGTDSSLSSSGWHIDDVVVTGKVAPEPSSISGFKWHDLNGDGTWDADEPALPGWTIYLDLNNNGELDGNEPIRITDGAGFYIFEDLPPGTYTVAELIPMGWEQMYPGTNLGGGDSGNLQNNAAARVGGNVGPANVGGIADLAFSAASTRSLYTNDELTSATQWVVRLAGDAVSEELASGVGAEVISEISFLANTFLWEFAAFNGVDAASAGHGTVADLLESTAGIEYFYPLVPERLAKRLIPNDPLFPNQWHLLNTGQTGGLVGEDANVTSVWDNYLGTGVVVAVVDDGLEHSHPDLNNQYLAAFSYDFNDNDADPSPGSPDDYHGTPVAGVIAATGNNGLGVSGVAPGASLAGIRLTAGPTTDHTIAQALLFENQNIDIYNHSWGPPDIGAIDLFPRPLTLAALAEGAENGRSGLGSIHVWAGGNGRQFFDNVNYDPLANSRFTIAVGAIDHRGVQSVYSEPGAPLIVSAYSGRIFGDNVSGITTTDLNGSYTNSFGGTSSAAPLVSGVIALMLEANPNLTSRDVQHILVDSARLTDAADSDWRFNGSGRRVNHKYGFGAIDAAAAVSLAENWTNVGPEISFLSGVLPVNAVIPDNNLSGVTASTIVNNDIDVEYVEIVFSATHPYRGNLQVKLTSPDGTESILAERRTQDQGANYNNWVFTSARHWGESSAGEWTLHVSDLASGNVGTWNNWQINVYGTARGSDSQSSGVHIVSLAAGQSRENVNFGNRELYPSLESFRRLQPTDSTTNANELVFRVEFNKPVQNVNAAAFQISGGSTAGVTNVTTINDWTYDVSIAGGNLSTFNGVVSLALNPSHNIRDLSGALLWPLPPAINESYLIDNLPPTVGTVSAPGVEAVGAGSAVYQFSVEFVDPAGVSVASFGSGNITVDGPNGYSQNAQFVSASPSGNGSPRTATYQITPPGGFWTEADNGQYTIRLNANQISDALGNVIQSPLELGDFTVSVVSLGDPQLIDILQGAGASAPRNFVDVGGTLYFTAIGSEDTGRELWRSNGREDGTWMVKDIRLGAGGSNPTELTNVNGRLYFAADDGVHGEELWVFDGNEVRMVSNLRPGGSSSPQGLVKVGDRLFFSANGLRPSNQSNIGRELWVLDGPMDEPRLVLDIRAGIDSSDPKFLTEFNGDLFFSAHSQIGVGTQTNRGVELLRSDGSAVVTYDIRPGTGSSAPSSNPSFLTVVGDTLFFAADDGTHGNELWKFDADAAGPALVRDIRPGSGHSNPTNLTKVGDKLYFTANDGTGIHLWISDGTLDGTMRVRQIGNGTSIATPEQLTNVDGKLYFTVDDGVHGRELWTSDGTFNGTRRITDITPGAGSSNPAQLTAMFGNLFFTADDGVKGRELWVYVVADDTVGNVADIFPGPAGSNPTILTQVGATLFFAADDGVHGEELWTLTSGVALQALMRQDPLNSLTNANVLVFRATFSESVDIPTVDDFEVVGGTTAVVSAVTRINNSQYDITVSGGDLPTLNGEVGISLSSNHNIRDTSGKPLLPGEPPINQSYLLDNQAPLVDEVIAWDVVQLVAGTTAYEFSVQFSDQAEIDISSFGDGNITVTGPSGYSQNARFVSASPGGNGFVQTATYLVTPPGGFWRQDDNGQYTIRLNANQVADVLGNVQQDIQEIGQFTVNVDSRGDLQLIDILNGAGASNPQDFVDVDGRLFFTAWTAETGRELWRSDGTPSGTVMVKNIRPGANGSNPIELTNVNGELYFSADDGINGDELWRSDGTEIGTRLVRDIRPGALGSGPRNLTEAGDRLFFTANNGSAGVELWVSDGSPDGTTLLRNINTQGSSSPSNLTNVNGTLFFSADTRTNVFRSGRELWKSDGTVAGTQIVADIFPGTGSSFPSNFVAIGNTLFFTAISSSTSGQQLWKSDGTQIGTVLVKEIRQGGANPQNLTDVNGILYFTANDGSGIHLWESDGTDAGTQRVQIIGSGAPGAEPRELSNVNGTLYFTVDDGVHGRELWRLDETRGAERVTDIRPGPGGSNPTQLTELYGRLYFTADDGVKGRELWVYIAEEDLLGNVADINPGAIGSNPSHLTPVSTTLFFSADDGTHGAELWTLRSGIAIQAIRRQLPLSSPTNADALIFRATFSESVLNVDSTDFEIVGDTTASIAVTPISDSQFDITVSGGNLATYNGLVGVTLKADNNITNSAGEPLMTTVPPINETFLVDNLAPQVSSITRADANPTTSDSVRFTVTFSEPVTGVDTADFALNLTGITGASIDNVSGTGATRIVSVTTGNGGGMIGLTLAANSSLSDLAGNELGSTIVIGDNESYTINRSSVMLISVTPSSDMVSDALVGSNTFSLAVLFSDAMDANDMPVLSFPNIGLIAPTGLTLASEAWSNDHRTFTATFDVADFDETIASVDVRVSNARDMAGNLLSSATVQNVFAIDTLNPRIRSIRRDDANSTDAASVRFTVEFTEPVTNVDVSDFALSLAGITGASILEVTGTGANRTVTVNTGTGDGKIGLELVPAPFILDLANNPLQDTEVIFENESYLINRSTLTVSSITPNWTVISDLLVGGDPFTLEVQFSKPMDTSVTPELTFPTAGENPVGTITRVPGAWSNGNQTYTATFNVSDMNVTIPDIDVRVSNARDTLGNSLVPVTIPNIFSVDTENPRVRSITRLGNNPTSAASVQFMVEFTELVVAVDASDFALNTTGISGASVMSVSDIGELGIGANFMVTVSTGSGDGTIGLALAANPTIIDLAGNVLENNMEVIGDNETFTINRSAPTVTVTATPPVISDSAVGNGTFTLALQFSKPMDASLTPELTFPTAGENPAGTITFASEVWSNGNQTYTATFNVTDMNVTIPDIDVRISNVRDTLGNTLAAVTVTDVFSVDTENPRVASILRDGSNPTNAASVQFLVTFTEPVNHVDAADFALALDGIAGASITGITGVGANYVVTVSTGSGDGTIGLGLAANPTIDDLAGNPLQNTAVVGDAETFTINRSALTVSTLTGLESGFSVSFSEAFNPDPLNLYDSFSGTLGPADITLVGDRVGLVRGSVVVSPDHQSLIFIKSGGPLEPDAYTVTLRSASNGFINMSGELLDGNLDGTPGGDYVNSFVIDPRPADEVLVSIPDFARGFGQEVNLPNNASSGIPITLSTGQNVTGIDLELEFDPTLLDVTGFSTTIPGASTAFNIISAGLVRITVSSALDFSSTPGQIELGRFAATVPDTAAYGAKHVVNLIVTELNDNVSAPRAVRADSGIHVAAFMGDSNASRTYSSADSTLLQRVTVGLGSGFTAFPLADPMLIGDINRSNTLTSADTTLLQRLSVGIPINQAPAPPTGITPPAPGGVDPRLSIPKDLAGDQGDTITIPVMLEVTETAGISVSGMDLAISYDPAVFSAVSNFAIGSAFLGAGFAMSTNAGIPGQLRIIFSKDFGPELEFGAMGIVFQFDATIAAGAPNGPTAINLMRNIEDRFTAIADNNAEELVLIPAPTNAADDPVDGVVTIGQSAPTVIVTATPPVISDSAVGNGTFTLALQFSKPMDTSVTPELTFPTAGENPAGTITRVPGAWSNGNQTYTATFNVADMNVTIPDIDVRISNARDTFDNSLVPVTISDVFSVDTENPRIASILRDGANPTNAASVQFLVTFTEPVNHVDAADFALAFDGITGASITGITGTGANYTVAVSTGSGDGTIGLGLAANPTIIDLAGNPLQNTAVIGDNETFTINRSAPTVTVTATPPVISDSAVGNGTFSLALQFSKPMDTSVTPELSFPTAGENPAGTITFASGVWSNGNQTYTASFNVTDLNVTIPNIDVRVSNARDTLGNTLAAVTVTDVFSVDTENPRVASIRRDGSNPTNAASVQFLVTFTEPVNHVDAADFALAFDGITGASITGITGAGANRTVTVSTGSGDGTIGLGLAVNPTIIDLAGNPLQNTTVIGDNETFTINRSAPTVTVTATPPVISDSAVGNGTFNLALQFSKPMDTSVIPELTFPTAGENPAGTITRVPGVWSNGNQTYTATFNVTDLNVTIPDIDVRISNARDTFGNSLAPVTVPDVFSVDTENPRVASIRRDGANPTSAASVQFVVTFTEPVNHVDAADFALALDGITGASITGITGTGANRTVTVSIGSGDGTIGLGLAVNPTISDLAGNPLQNTTVIGDNETFTINRSAPTVIVTATPPMISDSAVGNGTFNLALQFSKPMDTSVTPELTFPTAGENPVGTIAFASGVWSNGNRTYTATFNVADLNVTIPDIDVRVSNARDTLGNTLDPVTVANVFSIDTENPRIVSILRDGASPTNAASVQFLVTFTEPVNNVDAVDFSLNLNGITGASITGITGAGTNYTITVSTGSGDGTIGLGLAANPTINDLAGNPLRNDSVIGIHEAYSVSKQGDAPRLNDYSASIYWGQELLINLQSQVAFAASSIDWGALTIDSSAASGTVVSLRNGQIRYRALKGFVGQAQMLLTVRDIDGRWSNVASVVVNVTGSPLNNPSDFYDVNSDGMATPLDALLVLNRISRAWRDGSTGALSVDAFVNDTPLHYVDVDSNGLIEPLDALRVLNEIARRQREGAAGEGEFHESSIFPGGALQDMTRTAKSPQQTPADSTDNLRQLSVSSEAPTKVDFYPVRSRSQWKDKVEKADDTPARNPYKSIDDFWRNYFIDSAMDDAIERRSALSLGDDSDLLGLRGP